MIKNLLLFFSGVIICAAQAAQIYQWTDDKGIVHFSDIPHLGAKVINQISAPMSVSSVPINITARPQNSNKQHINITIIEPRDQATIRNNKGYLLIRAQIEPKLDPGFKLQIILDGTAIGSPQGRLISHLKGVERGAHRLELQLIDKQGTLINCSDPISIFMQRPRIDMGKTN